MQIQTVIENSRPRLRVKNPGGAPFGNRNALKHGWYTEEKLASAKALKAELAEMKLLCARVQAHVALAWHATMHNKPKVTVTRTVLTNGQALTASPQ